MNRHWQTTLSCGSPPRDYSQHTGRGTHFDYEGNLVSGGGGGGSYRYSWGAGYYYNASGNVVSFDEVYSTQILPNAEPNALVEFYLYLGRGRWNSARTALSISPTGRVAVLAAWSFNGSYSSRSTLLAGNGNVASSQGGSFGWDDAASIGMGTAGATGGGLHNIMVDRGKYLPRNAKTFTGQSYSIKKTGDIVLRSRVVNVTANAKYLNYARVSGKALGVAGSAIGIGTAVYDTWNNPTAGNYTKIAVRSFAVGAAFIPVVGWGVSLGVGAADAIWGDDFYDWIDR